jgi:mRNA interferase MazF
MKQGDVWLINLDPTIGSEIKKIRPAIIVNDDSFGKLPLRVIVPITEWKDRYDIAPWMIKIEPNSKNGLSMESSADCFQVRSISQERFIKRLGCISEIIMSEIKIGLSKVLSIEN